MDFQDFFLTTTELGATGRKWQTAWAIFCVLSGVGIAGYLGYLTGGATGMLAGIPTGALIGWVLAMFLRGLFIMIIAFVLIAALVVGWHYIFG